MRNVVLVLLLALLLMTPDYSRAQDQESAIDNVLKAGLMQGYPDGSFHPEGEITRAQLARIIDKTFNLASREPKFSYPFNMTDVPRNYWAYGSIQDVMSRDIMQGYREGRFYPDQPVSRAEALAIFAQAYGVYQYDKLMIDSILDAYPDSDQIPAWARKALATALQYGFADVAEGERIRPLASMTRDSMAYTLNEYLKRLHGEKGMVTPR